MFSEWKDIGRQTPVDNARVLKIVTNMEAKFEAYRGKVFTCSQHLNLQLQIIICSLSKLHYRHVNSSSPKTGAPLEHKSEFLSGHPRTIMEMRPRTHLLLPLHHVAVKAFALF